jgi:hypothetical protein
VYHVELRQFPHNVCQFNLSPAQLGGLVTTWVRGEVIDIEDRKWLPQQARLTIVEGPEIPLDQLTMGRGWTVARREGADVTEKLLSEAQQALGIAEIPPLPPPAVIAPPRAAGAPGAAAAQPAASGAAALSDPMALSMQIGSLLGADAPALLDAWRKAAADTPGLAPSDALARAEQALRDAPGG